MLPILSVLVGVLVPPVVNKCVCYCMAAINTAPAKPAGTTSSQACLTSCVCMGVDSVVCEIVWCVSRGVLTFSPFPLVLSPVWLIPLLGSVLVLAAVVERPR